MNKQILIRYGELTLKGKNRNDFEKRLLRNIKVQLKSYGLEIKRDRNRIYINEIELEKVDEVCKILKKIPGIHSYAIADVVEVDLEEIKKKSFEMFDVTKTNFRVSVKRINKAFGKNSMELEREIGGYILSNNDDEKQKLKVDLKNYSQEVMIEIHKESVYVFNKFEKGMGGLPIGTAGKALVMLSGGIDSPVAAILAMKRGLKIDLVHFSSPPYTNEDALEKVKDLAKELQTYDKSIRLIDVHITDLQVALNMNCDAKYQVVLLRRMMLRVMDRLCDEYEAKAIVTGENLSQVASQTLANMDITNSTVQRLILRPLLTMDKFEIIEYAKEFNTYEISIRPFDDCCVLFLPKSPVTNAKMEYTLKQESKIDYLKFIEEIKMNTFTSLDLLNGKLESLDNILGL